ncbi:hypothetical protein WJX74_009657 [Apatococcus lobatus]|uniref:Coenzyme Q-binding protein COQ10 START domain-containing protein n=1 Tax=Apatococcus lobatus TaxID=904363 RepID=A0AAW1SEW8_9CHLO
MTCNSCFACRVPQGRTRREKIALQPSGRLDSHRLGRFSGQRSSARVLGPSNGFRCQAKQWIRNSAGTNVDVPVDIAFALWEDRERICDWMPWIKSVKIQQNDTSLSRWTLSQDLFGRTWQFSWLARNLDPVHLKKIHWKSVEGSGSFGSALEVANRGEILFSQPSPASCSVTLTISYEVPDVLGPFANALSPTVEGILRTDMGRFAAYACKVQAAMASSNRQSGGL